MSDDPLLTPARVAAKLPHADEHLAANRQMAHLAPYYRWVLELAEGRLGARVLDAGCGIGNFVEVLRGVADEVLAVDLNPANLAVLRRRFAGVSGVEVLQADLDLQRDELAARAVDSIVCLDVLEHIEDDRRLLASFHDIVRPGGVLFVKVPAVPWLYGSIDIASDHHRRYSRRELVGKAREAGWNVRKARYMNLAGVLPYFLKSRVLKKQAALSNTYSPRQIELIARSMRLVRLLDRVSGPPLGQSLVLLADKNESR
jgi:2-polyprenyl-3-methyl-5-hydroxy-6-metoxy-1,4-benzoquinol methylase